MYFLLIVLFGVIQTNAQLDVVSQHQLDFSTAVKSIQSGNWLDASTWSNNQVPTAITDVIIDAGHTVYINKQGASSNQIVDLCKNLKIEQYGVLQMGHNTPNFAKDLRINGSILCNGTFSSGRNQPSGSGDGAIYTYNSRIYLNLIDETTYVSGSGYFHPKALSIASESEEKNLVIDLYNMVIDDNFAIKSSNRVTATIEKYAYIKIRKVLGLTGSTFQYSLPTGKASLTIKGIVVANDVSLFTKNTTSGETTNLTIDAGGSLYSQLINNNQTIASESAGFNFTINAGGVFKLGENADFNALQNNNPNFVVQNNGKIKTHYLENFPNKATITNKIDQFDPNKGFDASQIKDVFGSSHIAGWYNFTVRPYLLEGLDKYKEFGATSVKTTLSAQNGRMFNAYHFNHNWPNFANLKEVAQNKYLDSLFKRTHIKTHTFWTVTKKQSDYKQGPDFKHDTYLDEEQQFYDLTKHLLETYGALDKKFVFQNWEGDWMLRGQGVSWENNPSLIPDTIDWTLEGMARLFRARQRGTERARNEYATSKAKVYYAIEFNKLWMLKNGNRITMMQNNTPSVLGNVIPSTRTDMVSWSAYDGRWTNGDNAEGHALWKGLSIAHYFMNETGTVNATTPVQIGEFAINENPPYNPSVSEASIRFKYGRYIGVALDLDIPNFYLWNLFCSGEQGAPNGFSWEKDTQYESSFLYQWMDGKWLIEPDGSWGFAAKFLMEQWQNSLATNNFLAPENTITVYPNPSNGNIFINGIDQNSLLLLYDTNGRLQQQIKTNENQKIQLNHLSKGIYFLKIASKEHKIITKKLILN
ncbi:MAG: T9SS type A sorting domain-containing protein [Flavobacteriaceae bacterium]|nr:T9SS type A sorting domain-containing protein [Flavobacteriaceae bacterium]